MAVNAVISAFAAFGESSVSFLRLLEISFCSLFVFAALLLFVMLKFRSGTPARSTGIFISLWVISGAAAVIPFENLLRTMPPLVLTSVAIVFAIIFIRGVKSYAYSQ
jgi:hypothetical protein